MKFEQTKGGTSLIRINTDTYLSFGNSEQIKLIHIRYPTIQGSESRMFPIAMLKLPSPATKAIGKKNIKLIRELIREHLSNGLLPKDKVVVIGEVINSERTG